MVGGGHLIFDAVTISINERCTIAHCNGQFHWPYDVMKFDYE